jgi:hypothetical protein
MCVQYRVVGVDKSSFVYTSGGYSLRRVLWVCGENCGFGGISSGKRLEMECKFSSPGCATTHKTWDDLLVR